MYSRVKRWFDIAGAVIAIAVAAPLAFPIALAILVLMGRPVFFKQQRPGLNERLFTCYKFRTMTDARGSDGHLLSDDKRLTPFGAFLRSTSLDELPQLWNILCGDISFVGPRPLLESYLPFYTDRERLRHSVRPGLTGWAQTHGRNLVDFDERLALDIWYVEHLSFFLDMRILLRTARLVIRREGIAPPPESAIVPLNLQRQKRLETISPSTRS